MFSKKKYLHKIENDIGFYCALVELFAWLKKLKNKYRILITDAILNHAI